MNSEAVYGFRVRGYECGPDGLATLPTICNYLQEAASMHAGQLGFSRTDFAAEGENVSWVLTRLRVRMTRYPRWAEQVEVLTFPRVGRRVTAYRDFELSVGGERIGAATSEWTVIDLATRKIVPMPSAVVALANDERAPVMEPEAFSRLRWPEGAAGEERRFTSRRGDIDLNGHVNNAHYVEWLIETIPADAGRVADFEIAFKSETRAGEEVLAASVETGPGVRLGRATSPSGAEHAVACLRFG